MEEACSSQSSKTKGHEYVEWREPLCAQYHEQSPHQGILLCYLRTPRIKMWWESWTIKKAEYWRIDAFELWCWRVPWTVRRSNQSILKEISPEYSLDGLMLKLKLQYFGNLREELTHMQRPWCWERLKAGGKGDDRGWDSGMASLTQCTWVWVNSRSWWWIGRPGILRFMGSQRVGHDWTELNCSQTETLFW